MLSQCDTALNGYIRQGAVICYQFITTTTYNMYLYFELMITKPIDIIISYRVFHASTRHAAYCVRFSRYAYRLIVFCKLAVRPKKDRYQIR